MTDFEEYITLLWLDYINKTNEFENKYISKKTKLQQYNSDYYQKNKHKYNKKKK